MNGGEQYSLDMALLKIREEKRKRKMRSERAVILFVVGIPIVLSIRTDFGWSRIVAPLVVVVITSCTH